MNDQISREITEIQITAAVLAAQKERLRELCRNCPHEWSEGEYKPTFTTEPYTGMLAEEGETRQIEHPRWKYVCPHCGCFSFSETKEGERKGLYFNENRLVGDIQLSLF